MHLKKNFIDYIKGGEENKFLTDDFNIMVYIIIMNSLGFFYLSFVTSYVANSILFISGTKLGFVISSWTIGNIISATFAGAITDKTSKKRLIAIGSFGRGLSYFFVFTAIMIRSYNLLFTGYIVLGLGVGLYWTPFDALISEKSHKHHRSFAFSRRYLGIGVGTLIGGLLGFSVLSIGQKYFTGQYEIYFSTLLLYGIANWVAGYIFVKKVDENKIFIYTEVFLDHLSDDNNNFNQHNSHTQNLREENEPTSNSPQKINRKLIVGFIVLLIAFFFALTNSNISAPYLQIYMMNNITENEVNVMLIYLPSGIFSLLLAPKLGKIADKINPNLSIFITSTLGALLTFLLISTYNPIIFGLILIFDVAIANVADYLLNNIMSRISKKHRGKVLGARTVFQNLGAFIGPILGGIAYDNLGDRWPFIISIYVELSLILIFILAFTLIKGELEED